jgi:hypothetical protein
MTDETLQGETPAEAALPVPEVQEAEPATAPETVPETPEPEDEKPKAKGVQKRIDELTRNWREAERRTEQLLEYVTRIQGDTADQKQVEAAGTAPTLEQFGYDEGKYQAALMKFAETIADRKVSQKLSEWEQRQQQTARTQTFKQREADFASTVDDYAERVYDPSVPISSAMAEVIADSDIGPQLAYHLAENKDAAARIAAMSPVQAARELGKIEARLTAAKDAPKPVSNAPPPPPRIASAGTDGEVRPDDPSSDKLSDKEWFERRTKQLRKKAR